jgi:hypothetical protein
MRPDDWTTEEREALSGLHETWDGPPDLEDRLVRQLRREGLVRRPEGRTFPDIARLFTAPWPRTLAAAAVLALLLAASYLTGFRAGARETAGAVLAGRERERGETVLAVQQAGTAYLEALRELVSHSAVATTPEWARGRNAALDALHAAAGEMVRIAPDDPVAGYLIQALDRTRPDIAEYTRPDSSLVIWF